MSRVDNYGRKVWDKDYYSKSKEERYLIEESETGGGKKCVGQVLEPLSKEEIAQKRESYLDVLKYVGKSTSVSEAGDDARKVGGYWCELCQLSFKDSHTWIKHLNSQQHNQKMGKSIFVEKKSLDSVRRRLSELIEDFDKGTGIFSQNNQRKLAPFGDSPKKRAKSAVSSEEEYLDDLLDECDDEIKKELLRFDLPSSFM